MKERSVSRRDFLRGAGTMGVAAGAMAALGGAGVAVAAEEGAAAESAYGLACETGWVPVKKAACPGGPEGRRGGRQCHLRREDDQGSRLLRVLRRRGREVPGGYRDQQGAPA